MIDANAFFGRWPIRTLGVDDPEKFVKTMDTHGIDVAVVSSLRGMIHNTREGNNEIINLLRLYPSRFIGLCCVNPRLGAEECLLELDRCLKSGIKGIRLYPSPHLYDLNDWELLTPLMRWAEEHEFPVFVTMTLTHGIPFGTTPFRSLYAFVKRFKDVNVVATGLSYRDRLDALRLLRKSNNFYLELSLDSGVEAAKWYVERVGSERILMGTGYCLFYPLIGIAKVRRARIPEKDKERILHQNAASLFSIRK
ncbi:hypothetical protein CW702_02475 [Candidatus Bathyarchaeota archaeon]|nr:MAG: hypothetical protein CW702_02475 [Candidatus Bathyarchaeota archaeon]